MWSRPALVFVSLGVALALAVGLTVRTDARPAVVEPVAKASPSNVPTAVNQSASPAPAPTSAVITPALYKLRAKAQAKIVGVGKELEDEAGVVRPSPTAKARGRVNGNALGEFVPIENESALQAFHSALAKLQSGKLAGGKLRILAYGASHTQADIYTSYLRDYLQSRFGDGGLGFVQMAKLDKSYHTLDLQVESAGFSIEHAQKNAPAAHGWFGLLGAAGVAASSSAHAGIVQSATHRKALGGVAVEVFAMGEPGGGELSLLIDNEKRATWSTASSPPKVVVHSESSSAGFSSVTVKPVGNGGVRLFGISVERPTSGIVVDTLGISGTRAANWLAWDEASWAEQVKRRNPYLVTLAYGTNETSDKNQAIQRYEHDLDLVLSRLHRAAPQASCVLIGPGDVGKKIKGVWTRRHRLERVIEVQRRQALAHGCGFWDALAFMGDGGIARWIAAAPSMASGDHIHLTRRGYVKLGMGFGDALLRAFDEKHKP